MGDYIFIEQFEDDQVIFNIVIDFVCSVLEGIINMGGVKWIIFIIDCNVKQYCIEVCVQLINLVFEFGFCFGNYIF